MTQQRDIERLLDQWFSDGPDQAPDRVVDIVADRIERQSQRPAWRLQRRPFPMNTYAKIAVAAAAVLIVAVIGYNLLPGLSTGVGGPGPSASPSAVPTASPSTGPSPSAAFPAWFTPESGSRGAGILPSGSQTTRSFTPAFTYTVPQGWVNNGDEVGFYGLFPDTPANLAEFARSGELAYSIHMGPLDRPYFVCEAVEDNQGTAAEMVAAAAANKALAVSGVVDVALGSLTGKRFDVRADPDWKGPCPGDPPGLDLGDQRTRVFLLDVPSRGVIVIFVGSLHAADHEAFLAQAMPVVESFAFTN
jgi:hypothetical protein